MFGVFSKHIKPVPVVQEPVTEEVPVVQEVDVKPLEAPVVEESIPMTEQVTEVPVEAEEAVTEEVPLVQEVDVKPLEEPVTEEVPAEPETPSIKVFENSEEEIKSAPEQHPLLEEAGPVQCDPEMSTQPTPDTEVQ